MKKNSTGFNRPPDRLTIQNIIDRYGRNGENPPGRAIYRGSDASLKLIATPFVPDDIWEQPIR